MYLIHFIFYFYGDVPIDTYQMQKWDHKQLLDHLETILSIERRAVEKQINSTSNEYPSHALNGKHLYHAMTIYEKEIENGNTTEAAFQKMVTILQDHIIDYSTAETIAKWLQRSMIAKGNIIQSLESIKHTLKEKIKIMNSTTPSLPPLLTIPHSRLQMTYKGNTLVPTICFGADFPPNKYSSYLEFLRHERTVFVVWLYRYFAVIVMVFFL